MIKNNNFQALKITIHADAEHAQFFDAFSK